MWSVIIQKERGEFVNANGFNAWQGFDERGFEISFFDWEQMDSGVATVDPGTITVGSVRYVRRALQRIGIETMPLDYPIRLRGYLGRRIWQTTWAEVRSRIDSPGVPVFVKPVEQDKAFTGYVVSAFRDLIRTAKWPGEMKLWASEPFPFVSEWRYFVRRGEVIGVGHYKGDPLRSPDVSVIRGAVEDYAGEAPVAYGIDFGIAASGGTHLVEVNDGFSLGCLGLGPLAYSAFLEDRWRELVRTIT
ncbi:ATP-grasp domain-containing protein [Tautonia sp. JC769]|uniref:ATP-grasp domain-containing protein n=1 Tax=Tautonia sp. JC769 TaxID=3232135 RepID=UPI0034585A5C